MLVVTLNRRLGIFGYLHLKEMAGPEFASSGNAGMLDLVAAFDWCVTTSRPSAAIPPTSPSSASQQRREGLRA